MQVRVRLSCYNFCYYLELLRAVSKFRFRGKKQDVSTWALFFFCFFLDSSTFVTLSTLSAPTRMSSKFIV